MASHTIFQDSAKCVRTIAILNWTQPFIDASDAGIGVVLSQLDKEGNKHVVAYAHRLLSKADSNYFVTCKELLFAVAFLQHFRQYHLTTQLFAICMDHGALRWLHASFQGNV